MTEAYKRNEHLTQQQQMNQGKNEPSSLEIKLSSIAIDAVMQSLNLNLSPQQLQEFKDQTIKDAQAIVNEWEIEPCLLKDTKEN